MADRSLEIAAEHQRAGRLAQARDVLAQCIRRNPKDLQATWQMVSVLLGLAQNEQAEFHARRAVETAPRNPEQRHNLGVFYSRLGRHNEAAEAFAQAAALAPTDPMSHRLQVAALVAAFRLPDALAAIDSALARFPGDEALTASRSHALLMLGRAAEAVEQLRGLTAATPDSLIAARLLANSGLYDHRTPPDELFGFHRRCGELLERRVPEQPCPLRDPNPDRPIRIGFLSADLCSHVVAVFLSPVIQGLLRNSEQFQLAAYHTGSTLDETSKHVATLMHVWRHAPGLDPRLLAEGIRSDGIDILIELGGYTQGSPIEAAAWRAAPIQVSYLGYPSSTGLTRIDYRIVDSLTDPATGPHAADALATERLLRLDPCFLCFPPIPLDYGGDPDPGERAARPFTFGSFNALQKINQPVLELWARILARSPGSRLAIKCLGLRQEVARRDVLARAVAAGIEPDRLTLLPPVAGQVEHLRAYHGVDVALDTYPYCGTTTTCEALSMGVPVVSLVGPNHAARVGLSVLSAAGLPELAAGSPDEYVELAAALAADRPRLEGLRHNLRARVAASALCDATAFGKRFGDALRAIWRERCAAAGRTTGQ